MNSFKHALQKVYSAQLEPTPETSPLILQRLILKYMQSRNSSSNLLQIIIEHGSVHDLELAIAHGYPLEFDLLGLAAEKNRVEMMDVLLKTGIPIDFKSAYTSTALGCAARAGRKEAVQFLLNRGSVVDTPNYFGITPLMEAVQFYHLEVMELLVSVGGSLNHRDIHGRTCFHLVARFETEDLPDTRPIIPMVHRLAQLGGKEFTLDNGGQSPIYDALNYEIENGVPDQSIVGLEMVRALLQIAAQLGVSNFILDAVTSAHGHSILDNAIHNLVVASRDTQPQLKIEEMNIFLLIRACGAKRCRYFDFEIGDIKSEAREDFMNLIGLDEFVHQDEEADLQIFQEHILTFLRAPLSEEKILEIRRPIFFSHSLTQILLNGL